MAWRCADRGIFCGIFCGISANGGRAIKPGSDVLRRKLRQDQKAGPAEQVMSPVKAARMCLARAADQAFDLALRVAGIRQSRLDMADLVAAIHDDWALFPLLHEDGQVGAVCIDPETVVALVEQQTTGRIPERTGDLRPLTRTDISLSEPLIEQFLVRFDAALEGAPTDYWTRGYRLVDPVPNRHAMALQLDASEYRSFDISISFLGTSRVGEMRIYLPIKEKLVPVPKKKPGAKNNTGSAEGDPQPKSIRRAALEANVEMHAVMCRLKLPLSDLSSIEVGQLLKLPRDPMGRARLMDKSEQVSIPIKLGQLHGMRAVRLAPHRDREADQIEQEGEAETNALPALGGMAAPAMDFADVAGMDDIEPEPVEFDADAWAGDAATLELEALLSDDAS